MRLFLACGLLLFIPTFVMVGELAIRGIQLLFVGDDWRGTPAYRGVLKKGKESEPGVLKRIASLQFSDVQACIGDNDQKSLQIDWVKIDNSRQAEVCIFRVVHTIGDVSSAAEWFASQGFSADASRVIEANWRKPVTRRLDARWSIRDNGPRFESLRAFTYFFPEVAYGFVVNAHWDMEVDELLYLDVGYLTK